MPWESFSIHLRRITFLNVVSLVPDRWLNYDPTFPCRNNIRLHDKNSNELFMHKLNETFCLTIQLWFQVEWGSTIKNHHQTIIFVKRESTNSEVSHNYVNV